LVNDWCGNIQGDEIMIMHKRLLAAAAVAAMAMGSQSAMAQSASGDAAVTVVTPILVSKTTNLVFGQLYSGTGTSIISTAGVQNGGTAGMAGTQTVSAAVFSVQGQGAFAYTPTITVTPATPAVAGLAISAMLGRCGTGADVVLPPAAPTAVTGCVLTAGAGTVAVGVTVTITAAAIAGVHTVGTIAITVAYN
jgi:hypothetical protein